MKTAYESSSREGKQMNKDIREMSDAEQLAWQKKVIREEARDDG